MREREQKSRSAVSQPRREREAPKQTKRKKAKIVQLRPKVLNISLF